jgi:glycosyltransferase involved in cell wall biosynthesis
MEGDSLKAIFAHSIRIKKDYNGNMYTHSSYNENVWKRYNTISKQLSVFVREEQQVYSQEEASKKFEVFDNSNKDVVYFNDIYRSIFTFINPINHIINNSIIKKCVNKHDCVIARLPSYAGFKAIKYAKKRRIPYICEVVACPWDALWNHTIKGKILAPFSYLQLKKTISNAPYVVYVTNEFLQNRYPTKGKTIACSNVTLAPFDETVLENRLLKIRNKTDERIKIGTVAAVYVRYKGQQYVIRALGKLKKQGITNFEYHLVGGGDQSYLRSQAKKYDVEDQVKFIGPLPHDKVFEWLDTIDIYAQPSRQEGLPRALIEAMSRGLPCMGAKTGGIPELLEPSFLFSNSRKEIDEIINILFSMTPQTMKAQACRNFEKSKEYEKDIIEKRRREFFEEFKNSAVTNGKALQEN